MNYVAAGFSPEEMRDFNELNAKARASRRESKPYYRKSGFEHGPTWAQKKEFVHNLINEIDLDLEAKLRLQENMASISHFQFRGFKYGLVTSAAVFFCFPVIRKQMFLRRLALSSIPMMVFLKWGYEWGHQNFWRKSYPVITTYEIGIGTRSHYTGK